MKKIIVFVVLLIILACVICTFTWVSNYGSTGAVIRVTTEESRRIQDRIDGRYQALDAKLDRIEGKLDRLLKIAERPLPDGMQEAR